ncbi:MAG TPA: tetratricopeptide repeat protein, partial [Thermosynechococcaceae cyanobacterium]
DDYLSAGGKAVLTVTGATQLGFLRLGQEKSEQEIFFGYLQWTRESLPEFRYPIVLWMTQQLLTQLRKQAPDFWSWRKDVFRFASKKTATVPNAEIMPIFSALEALEPGITEDDNIPLADLQALIAQMEQNQPDDPLLATLYSRMGSILSDRLDRGEFLNYLTEMDKAVEYFEKAIAIQENLGLVLDAATSCNDLALLYKSQGRYSEAEPFHLRSLSIREQYLGEDHPAIATSLNNLAALYQSQRRYSEAEPLYLRSLAIDQGYYGDDHPEIAMDLNNLAALYQSQGRYPEAEPLYLRSLSIREQQLGIDHPNVAQCLNNLAELHQSQGRYSEAEPLLLRSLSIREQQLGADHPDVAQSLNNLAGLYYFQEHYSDAELLYLRSLSIKEQQLGADHPSTKLGWQNFRHLLQQAIESGRTAELSDHPTTRSLLQQFQADG